MPAPLPIHHATVEAANQTGAEAGVSVPASAVAGVTEAAVTAGGALAFFFESRIFFILSGRFSSLSVRTVRNLITGSVPRKGRSSSSTTAARSGIIIRAKQPAVKQL